MLSLIRNGKTNKNKLSNREYSTIQYPLTAGTYFEGDKKSYVIGKIQPSRANRLLGRKTQYYVIEVDNKDENKYRVLRRTDDEKSAIFTMNNRVAFELLTPQFKALKKQRSQSSKNATRNGTVRRRNRGKDDPILKIIWTCDLRPNDRDSDTVWQAKKSLASIRPNDFKVVIYPENYNVG